MFNVRNLYGALGTMLFLIALYLVLRNATNAATIIRAGGAQTSSVFRTLQGR